MNHQIRFAKLSEIKKGSLTEKALRAMREAVAKVVEEHRREGRPLAIWRDGKVAWVHPDELSVGEKPGRRKKKRRFKKP